MTAQAGQNYSNKKHAVFINTVQKVRILDLENGAN